jgi:exopolysaccharide/PEP-CTERM locus tyrosine autokinase
MSVVEKTLQKLQDARQKRPDPAPELSLAKADSAAPAAGQGAPAPAERHALAAPHHPPIVLDRPKLRALGLLPPEEQERRLSSQYRKIKRPLIAGAIGRGEERLPKGYMIMLASAMSGEGKTFTALNLALSIAREKDLRVLLIDADVAKPHLSRTFGLEGEPGLLDVLREPQMNVEAVIRRTDVPTLTFLPAGKSSADATELLASRRMEEVAALLGKHDDHRMVIFDSPPLMQTTESPALVQVVGQILVVVRAEWTPQPVLLDALENLQDHPAVSLMLNQSMRSETSAYYYYGYGDDGSGADRSVSSSDTD